VTTPYRARPIDTTSANSVGVLVEQYADRGASLGVRASFNPPIRARCLTILGGRYVGVLHGSAGNVAWLEAALCEWRHTREVFMSAARIRNKRTDEAPVV
jgi:hypothetical protein